MAVAVLAVGLTMISRSFTNCIRVLEAAGDYSTAVVLAEEALWNLEITEPDDWESDGKFKDNPKFRWSQRNKEKEDLELLELKVDIEWRRRNRDYKLRIATFAPGEEKE